MDNQVTNPLDQVYNIFTERQHNYETLTTRIIDKLKPTVLDAVVEVLEADPQNVQWLDINFYDHNFVNYSDAVLMISCVVEYDSEDDIPALLHEISPEPDPDHEELNKRLVRVGVPFDFVTESKEDIKMMLYRTLLGELQETGNIDEDELWDAIIDGAHEQGIGTNANDTKVAKDTKTAFDHVSWFERLHKGKVH